MIKIKRGLDLPILGEPQQRIHDGPPVRTVALLGGDYVGLKPTMLVEEGQRVRQGQPLFRDKQYADIVFTAPGTGVVARIERGTRRALRAVQIDLDGGEHERFNAYSADEIAGLNAIQVRENLLASGLWTSFRTRPYSRIPAPETPPKAIFVTAMDTNPLAAAPEVVIGDAGRSFALGLTAIATLTDGPLFVCTAPGSGIEVPALPTLRVAEFAGPHPAGLPGTHIHFLAPVSVARAVWHLNYQDVISIGRLFTTGELPVERVISLAGPVVSDPRLIRTRLGASTADLVSNELVPGECRVISGSILSGHRAAGWAEFLGRYHLQVCALAEGRERQFLGWLSPGRAKFSAANVLLSSLFRGRRFALNTSQNGSPRAMVPIGSYERVMPLDILPTQLLRALLVNDTDAAQRLGCLELDEEDLALCSFVCPGKYDYGPVLRRNLDLIQRDG